MFLLLGCQVLSVLVHGHEGGGPHAMAGVEELLLLSELQDKLNHGGKVIARHLVPSEVPEPALGVLRVQKGVIPAVGVPSKVSHPDVIASISENVTQALCWVRNDPIS